MKVTIDAIMKLIGSIDNSVEIEENTALFDTGVIDSFVIFDQLLPQLMEQFEIEISPLELVPENFDTPMQIYKYIRGKQNE